MISGIYVIENIFNGHKYVGLGEDVEERMWHYHTGCHALLGAIKKYGKDSFIRYIIKYCDIDELDYWERYYIKELHSHVSEGGYNISWGGDTPMRGRRHSDETKDQIRRSTSGDKNHFFGQHHSDESRYLISKNHANVSGENNPHFGEHPSDETRALISKNHADLSGENSPMWGTHPSEETLKKQSIAHTGKKDSDETRKRKSMAVSGENNPRYGTILPYKSSKYHGVFCSNKKYGYYRFKIGQKFIASFKSEDAAARAYNEYVIDHNLNLPLNIIPT
jgi:group I intron endonuclease